MSPFYKNIEKLQMQSFCMPKDMIRPVFICRTCNRSDCIIWFAAAGLNYKMIQKVFWIHIPIDVATYCVL